MQDALRLLYEDQMQIFIKIKLSYFFGSRMSPPVAHEVNLETDEVIKCRVQPPIENMKKLSASNGKRNIA
jgi:hypothetical protein